MDNENEKRVYCTNMNEKDPIIEKFLKEYDDIIVNFDITYADGVAKSYSCGVESPIFGEEDDGCIESKINAEEMKSHFSEAKIGDEITKVCPEKNDKHIDKNIENKCDDGWICEKELEKIYNMSNLPNEEPKKIKPKERKITGNIIVYATFLNKFGKRIKGVKMNLYKLNGIISSKCINYAPIDITKPVNICEKYDIIFVSNLSEYITNTKSFRIYSKNLDKLLKHDALKNKIKTYLLYYLQHI